MEAAEIWSGRCRSVAFAAELVGTPTSMETIPVATKVSKRLALRNKGRRRCVGCGQQRSIDGSRPHGWMRQFMNKFMLEKMIRKICIPERFVFGHKTFY